MKFGLQLFGALYHSADETMALLKDLKALGFARIEPCVAFEAIPGLERPVWTADWLMEQAPVIRALGLEMVSCHLFCQDIAAHAPVLERLSALTGIRQYVVKSPEDLSDEGLNKAAMDYMRAADALAGFGAELLIHNEGRDIAARAGGTTAYEHLLDLCLGKVGAQVDVGWVWYAGEDPDALLERNRCRVRSLHYKDYADKDDPGHQTAIGLGRVDTPACVQFAREMGIPQIVDQDAFPGDMREDLAKGIRTLSSLVQQRPDTVSYLNLLDVDSGEVRVLKRFEGIVEAPNWVQGREELVYNADGRLWRYDIPTGSITPVDTGFCDHLNNDHVLAADGSGVAVSHMTFDEGFSSRVYIVPFGGKPRLVTENSPSFLHGWSPDGKELVYCAFRQIDGERQVDVYAVSAQGGPERRLTEGGFNDGPEYSPDGKHIWFNSTRSGSMQAWRMDADGSHPRQMTFSRRQNWFPHVSPDGKRVAYISYGPEDLEPAEHLPNMVVELWLMRSDGTENRKLLTLYGGQGSMNVNSWAADSRRLAFVSYERV